MTLALSAVVLPDRHPVPTFLDDVRAAEEARARTVWTYDHPHWPRPDDARGVPAAALPMALEVHGL